MKTPFGRLLTGSVIYGLGTVLVQLINILLMPLITEYLSPSEYGEVAILNLACLFLVAIFSLGVGVSIGLCYFDYQEKKDKDSLVWSGFTALLISCLFLGAVGFVSASTWTFWLLGKEDLAYVGACLLIAAAANILSTPFEARLRLDERPKAFIFVSLFTTLAIGVPTLFFVIGLKRGVNGYFEALALGRIASFLIYFLTAGRGAERLVDWAKARKLVVLGLPVIVQFVLLYILQFGNVEGLKRYAGLDSAGIYSVGLTIGMAINIVVSSISNAWVPFFLSYTNNREEAKVLFGRITTYYIFGVGMVSFLFYYFAAPIVSLLSADSYSQAAIVVGPIATGFYLLGIYNMALPPVYFAKELGVVTYMLALSAITLVCIAYLLIPPFGLSGAAWAFVFAYAVLDVLLILWSKFQGERYFQIQYEIGRVSIFSAAYFASVFLLHNISGSTPAISATIYFTHFILMLAAVAILMRKQERGAVALLFQDLLRRAS